MYTLPIATTSKSICTYCIPGIFFQSIHTLENDEMTALWPNDKLTFTFSNSIPKWTSFVKEIFGFDA